MEYNPKHIRIRGVRTHNLKNINLDLPRNKLIVVTGISGSGKSSLVFDTLYAEGQRRYVESLSSYARQFLGVMEKPDVDLIEGLSPAIAIEQKASSHNPRSTVGTVTEIYDYLRLLFARVGTPFCPKHGVSLDAQSVSQMVDSVFQLREESKVMILAPVIVDRKGEHLDVFNAMQAKGFVRFRVRSGSKKENIFLFDSLPRLKKTEKHCIDVVVDRLTVRYIDQQRLAESFETALRLSGGRVLVVEMDNDKEHMFSSRFACPICAFSLPEVEPRQFSFNSPMGACAECHGLGEVMYFDPNRIVVCPEKSLADGAIKNWHRENFFYFRMLECLSDFFKFDLNQSFCSLSEEVKKVILFGSGTQLIPFSYLDGNGTEYIKEHVFEGVVKNLERRYRESDSVSFREDLAQYQNKKICPSCYGTRLKEAVRYIKLGQSINDLAIHEVTAMPLWSAMEYFNDLRLSGAKEKIAKKIIHEIILRLKFLNDVGLNYLSLDRRAETLSGGESQRIRLASQIGSGLTGVMYVLDEPSIGLHQRDNDRLIGTLKHLRDLGNSLIIVEHDEDMIRSSDYVVDIGPGAGKHGGTIIAQGTPNQIQKDSNSITGQYLSGNKAILVPKKRFLSDDRFLKIKAASGNNLKQVSLSVPIGLLTCVTGVSGSGKSTLVNDTLYKAVARHLYGSIAEPAAFESISGLEYFDKVINIDQSPIGRTPRSNPATYTGLFTLIREIFAGLPTAKERGYGPGRFSFNVKGGRCEACHGDGVVKIAMHFLPDIYVPCDICQGTRYGRETLEIFYKEKNIHDVLNMTVEVAMNFFAMIPAIKNKLKTLLEVGLGYITLGQSAITLSGGEAQRIKLSLELSKRSTGRTLYILDEPTTGLHFEDIAQLLLVIQRLRNEGNTIVVIEHNLDVIKTADWIIDLGPEGGDKGGSIVAVGSPEEVAMNKNSFTGRYLAKKLSLTV